MNKYTFTIQITGYGTGPLEAYDNAVETFKDNPVEYDNVRDEVCEELEQEESEDVYYMPKTDENCKVINHDSWVFSFEVWRFKQNLLEDYPNCIVETIKKEDIENPIIID